MSSYHFIDQNAEDLKVSPAFLAFSGVRIIVGEDDDGNQLVYEAGDTTGRVLEVTNPWGTQSIANDMLQRLSGYEYQPWSATGTLLDPASELGDVVVVDGVVSLLASAVTDFSALMPVNASAPEGSDIDHEYPYTPIRNREIARKINQVKASLIVDISSIEARVETTEGDISSLTVDVSGIETRVETAEGNISTLTQTATSIEGRVSDAEGNISTLTQTTSSIEGRVTTAEGNISTVTQTANKINWVVASGTSASNFTLTDRAISLVADTIDLTGYVTFNSLSTAGSTAINGDNITTGTISADRIDVDDLMVRTIYAPSPYNFPLMYTSFTSGDYRLAIGADTSAYSNRIYKLYLVAREGVYIKGSSSSTGLVFDTSGRTIAGENNSYKWDLGTIAKPFDDVICMTANVHAITLRYNNNSESSSADVTLTYSAQDTSGVSGYALIPSTDGRLSIGTTSKRLQGIFCNYAYLCDSTGKLSFFGATAYAKQTVNKISSTSSATTSDIATKVNDILTALKNYGLITSS